MKSDDGSDIFTQPHHTTRTSEVYTRTKNNVGSKTCQLQGENALVFLHGFFFVLMQKYDDSC